MATTGHTAGGRWTALLITFILMVVLWYYNRSEKPVSSEEVSDSAVYIPNKKENSPPPSTLPKAAPPPAEFQEAPPAAPTNNLTDVLERFHLCLSMQKGEMPQPSTGGLNTWVQYLQSRLGEPVFNSEEWRNTDLQLANGEKRRIRVEYDMGENEEYVKKLKYSVIGPNNELIPLSVSSEHAENPTDAFIETLEREGDVTVSEKAFRMYFKDGSELYAVERNGVVKDLDMSREGKLFRCTNMDTPKFTCECL